RASSLDSMIFRRLYHDRLAQASYLIACEASRLAIVVDPVRDVAPYVEAAALEDVRIAYVTETHLHADFLSGAEALARRTGATLLLSGEGDSATAAARLLRTGAEAVRDGTSIAVGRVRLNARLTPGHTPEHLSFMVTDEAIGPLPVGMLTGDFLFAGDVGRPDLLERAVGILGTMRQSAAQLFRSLQTLRSLPEYLQIWPGHGAGSSCGKALGAVPQSTLGYELRSNWAFQVSDEESFIDEVLRDQPDPPAYFARMKELNATGVSPMPRPADLPDDALRRAAREGALVVDMRAAKEFVAAHAAGSLNIPIGRSFLHWAGSLLDPARDIVLIAADETRHQANIVARDLALIGFDRVLGTLQPSALQSLAPHGMANIPVIAAADVVGGPTGVTIVDVRTPAEWNAGHIPGAVHVPLTRIADHLNELRDAGPLLVHCQGGARSVIAASVLRSAGIENVTDVEGGYPAWLHGTAAAAERSS
ncbi:MAG: beta-lactamase domain protein, partial [Gemmatimonadetes bacterium]|nr:beta-lactamase domain protein [Gemmatimonadota bacterium]